MSDLFRDDFTGAAANFSAPRVPDGVGAAWEVDAGESLAGSLTHFVVDGAGNCATTGASSNTWLRSNLGSRVAGDYTLEYTFKLINGGLFTEIDCMLSDYALDARLVRVRVTYLGSSANARFFVYDSTSSSPTYNSGNIAFTASGATQTVTAAKTGAGIDFSIDGVVVASTATIPDLQPDAVVLHAEQTSTYATVGSLRLFAPVAPPPDPPTDVIAYAGNASATVVFTPSTGTYTVISSPAGGTDSNAGSSATTHAITGLTNGTAYTFTVVANNGLDSAPSDPSNSITPHVAVADHNLLVKNVIAGVPPADAVPGTPGSPGRPAYCADEIVTRWASFREQFALGIISRMPPVPLGEDASIGGWLDHHGGVVRFVEHVCYDAIAPTPGTRDVPGSLGTPANYQIGWNAGARSVEVLPADGQYQFTIPGDTSGIVTGFNDSSVDAGYLEIDHALYFESGHFRVVEDGVQQTTPTAFASTDRFTISRIGARVKYFRNTTLIYRSLMPSTGPVVADASLYFGGDHIINAALTRTVSAAFAGDTATVSASLEDVGVRAFGGEAGGAFTTAGAGFVAASLEPLEFIVHGPEIGTDDAPYTGSVAASLDELGAQGIALDPPPGIAGLGTVYASLDDLGVTAVAGLFAPTYAGVNASLDDLGVLAIVLNGGLGSVSASLESLGVVAADTRRSARVQADLGELEVLALDNANGAPRDLLVWASPDSAPSLIAVFTVGPVGSLAVNLHPAAASVAVSFGMDARLVPAAPSLAMTGFVGGVLNADLVPAAPSLAMTGSVTRFLNVELEPAAPSLSAALTAVAFLDVSLAPAAPSVAMTGTVAGVLRVALTPSPPSLAMSFGMDARLAPASNQAVSMVGTVGIVLNVLASVEDEVVLAARMVQGCVLNVNLTPSAPFISPVLLVALMPAGVSLVAQFTTGTGPAYEGYSLTLLPSPEGLRTLTSRIATCPFDQILRFGNAYVGIAAGGIYELTGDTFAGAPIIATVKTAQDDLGTQQLKRTRAVRVTGEVGDDFGAALIAQDTTTDYEPCYDGAGVRTHRGKVQRGYRLSHVAYAFSNTEGKFFRLNTVAPENDVQKRTQGE